MPLFRRFAAPWFVALVSLAPLTARADGPAPAAAPASDDDPEVLYRKGNEAYRAGQLEDAYAYYLRAFAQKKSYDVAGNLGAVELELGKARDAAEHLALSAREFPVNGSAAARQKTSEALATARQQIGAVRVAVSADGADVSVDGKRVGVSPLPDELFLDPGQHTLEASKAGVGSAKESVSIARGEARSLTLTLASSTTPSASASPAAPPAPPAPTVAPEAPRKSVPLLVAGGVVGLGALGAGIGLLVASGAKGSDADALLAEVRPTGTCPNPVAGARCDELKSLRESKDTLHNVGMPLLVGGGVVLAATAVYALWPSAAPKTERAALAAAPIVGPGTGGVSVAGSF